MATSLLKKKEQMLKLVKRWLLRLSKIFSEKKQSKNKLLIKMEHFIINRRMFNQMLMAIKLNRKLLSMKMDSK